MSATRKKKINLGKTVDELYELRAKRLQLEKQADELKKQETQLQSTIFEGLADQNLTGATGEIATASVGTATVGTVVDWDALETYIDETKYFHLFQRRISNGAYLELLEKAGGVPGVEPTTLTKLNLTRSKR